MFCRIPCAKGWSELQENIRGRGGSQWIIRTGHVGAGGPTPPPEGGNLTSGGGPPPPPPGGRRAPWSRGGWGREKGSPDRKSPPTEGQRGGPLCRDIAF